MVKLNKKKYDNIIENFATNSSKTHDKNKTIIDSGKKVMESFNNIKKDMQTEHFMSMGKSNPFSKIEKFFKQIEEFFKKIKRAFTFTRQKLIAIILTIVFPFFGQLVARIIYLNGSLDKPWLFFFSIPPLSLIPALLIMFGMIKKGKGGKPYDSYILLPIIVAISSDIFLKKYFLPYKVPFVKLLLIFITVFIIYWFKSRKICKNSSAPVSKIIVDTLATYVLIGVISIVLKYVPVIGVFIRVLAKIIPYSHYLIDAMSIFVIYVAINMVNGSSKKYCSKPGSIKMIIGFLILSIILTLPKKKIKN
jgi:hypothetical protein